MESVASFVSGWYAVLPSKQLKNKKPVSLTCFGMDLVLWRAENGQISCFLDRCPHRGAKLSIGNVKYNCLECPYHGFRFNINGSCELAPEFSKPVPGLKVQSYPTKESMDMIWILYGNENQKFDFSDLEKIHNTFDSAYCETSKKWNSHITYCIENQLDYTHLPNVHKNTIGRGFVYPKDPDFILNKNKIIIYFEHKNPVVSFYFPNVWVLHVSKKMNIVMYFIPIGESQTMLRLRSYSTILTLSFIKFFLTPILNKTNKIILKQDQRVVASQGLMPSYASKNDVLMKNDQAIKYFREVWLQNIM